MTVPLRKARLRVLVLDVGGTHVKALVTGRRKPLYIPSGPTMTAREMTTAVRAAVRGWDYDVVSIGYPGQVRNGRPWKEPSNLGGGWVGFDFERTFRRPVKILNDAAMQALGSYEGGRMLFLGLGTGLGSAMILDGELEPMELGHIPYKHGKTYEDYVGEAGLQRLGLKRWREEVDRVVTKLTAALEPDYVVIGGGNVRKLKRLPPGARPGDNTLAFQGGFALWKSERKATSRKTRDDPRN